MFQTFYILNDWNIFLCNLSCIEPIILMNTNTK